MNSRSKLYHKFTLDHLPKFSVSFNHSAMFYGGAYVHVRHKRSGALRIVKASLQACILSKRCIPDRVFINHASPASMKDHDDELAEEKNGGGVFLNPKDDISTSSRTLWY